jgi:hypothetical protein
MIEHGLSKQYSVEQYRTLENSSLPLCQVIWCGLTADQKLHLPIIVFFTLG